MKWSKPYWFSGDYIVVREGSQNYGLYLRSETRYGEKTLIGSESTLTAAKKSA